MIWNGLTNIIVFYSVFNLPILEHYVGPPSGITQAGVEMSHLVIIVLHVLVPGQVSTKEQSHQWACHGCHQ